MEATSSMAPNFRVLTRPSSSSSAATATDPLNATNTSPPSTIISNSATGGYIVVGVVGRRSDDVTQFLNRLLDAHVFGSGNRDTAFPESDTISLMNKKRISYYVDDDRHNVFVQFSWESRVLESSCLASGDSERYRGFIDREEIDCLRGLLFVFSVCHIVIFIHEGIRFETQLLKTFRTLQTAKHSLAPYVRTRVLPGLLPVPVSGPSSSMGGHDSGPNSVLRSSSPGRIVIRGRSPSTIGLMSGSLPTLLPGQCTPIILFAFLDDFPDALTGGSHNSTSTHSADASILGNSQGNTGQQGSGILHIPGGNLQPKASNPVLMLARSTIKTEGGFKKRLQASLEAQIRFLIKKCRIITGVGEGGASGIGHTPRTLGSSTSQSVAGPLFTLDASRAVAILDRTTNCKGQTLDVAIEEILSGKESLESLLSENASHIGMTEDILSIREFLNRQNEVLRGKGGMAPNSASASVGVGMVAAAAAAAAASAAASAAAGGSMKSVSCPPELPNLESWLAVCSILSELMTDEKVWSGFENNKTSIYPERSLSGLNNNIQDSSNSGCNVGASESIQGPLEAVMKCLESGKDLNMNFSAAWCKRALPTAKEVYMKGLPYSYPTTIHNAQLEKALRTFQKLVRGPAVPSFIEKLREDCETTWKSGRQLCDAVSLTGKPCVYQIHEAPGASKNDSENKSSVKQHLSGYVFLHACACGRSRQLRHDPFDFESANVSFFHFPNCEDNLPSLVIPFSKDGDPMGSAAWSLVRLGGTKYYDPSAGVRQSGFCANENFLFKWTISLVGQDTLPLGRVQQNSFLSSTTSNLEHRVQNAVAEDQKKRVVVSAGQNPTITQTITKGKQGKGAENLQGDDLKLNPRKTLPAVEMKKAFAEVVAQSSYNSDSAFPPLQHKQQQLVNLEKVTNKWSGKGRKDPTSILNRETRVAVSKSYPLSGKNVDNTKHGGPEGQNGFIVGDNTIPMAINQLQSPQPSIKINQIIIYVGFEHECSYGHRFLLSLEHLKNLGSPYADFDSGVASKRPSENGTLTSRQDKQGIQQTQFQHIKKSKEDRKNSSRGLEVHLNQSGPLVVNETKLPNVGSKTEGKDLCYKLLNEGEGPGYSLLNMDLPIYMNCPHCTHSSQSNNQGLKFASTLSQLQRIFMVTPPYPTVLATCPVVQFEKSCLLSAQKKSERFCRFSLGSKVILPPESFVSLRLPFVYGERLEDGSLSSLLPHPSRPELTAWIIRGTALQLVSKVQ